MSGQVDGVDDAYTMTCRFTMTDDDYDMAASHLGECTVNRAQLRVADGCYTPPTPRPWFRLDESTSAILTVISLILALPLYGLYRWYRTRRARQQVQNDDEQAQPLVGLGDGIVDDDSDLDRDVSLPERGHTEARSSPNGACAEAIGPGLSLAIASYSPYIEVAPNCYGLVEVLLYIRGR